MTKKFYNHIVTFSLFVLLLCTRQSEVKAGFLAANMPDNTLVQWVQPRTINNDLIYRPVNAGMIAAVAWDDYTSTTVSSSFSIQYWCLCPLTTPVVTPLPTGAYNPDIVLLNDMTDYDNKFFAAVTYNIWTGTVTEVWLSIYGIDVSTPTPVITAGPSHLLSSPGAKAQQPHIDGFVDVLSPYFWSVPTMHEYVVVWGETNGVTSELKIAADDITSTSPTILTSASNVAGVVWNMPDVAAVTDVTNNHKTAFIAYTSGGNLEVLEHNITMAWTNVGLYGTFTNLAYPRIEAMSIHDPTASTPMAKWQTVAMVQDMPFTWPYKWEVYTVNSNGVAQSVSDVTFSYDDNVLPVVAAGDGSSPVPLGNQQYTVGWFFQPLAYALCQAINHTTGIINNPDDFIINYNPAWANPMVTGANSTMAMAHCSNWGQNLYSVWYNGSHIKYKYATNTTYMFKPTSVSTVAEGKKAVYPNPVATTLNVAGFKDATYTITNAMGQVIRNGNISTGRDAIDLGTISTGMYFISLVENGETYDYKFSKL